MAFSEFLSSYFMRKFSLVFIMWYNGFKGLNDDQLFDVFVKMFNLKRSKKHDLVLTGVTQSGKTISVIRPGALVIFTACYPRPKGQHFTAFPYSDEVEIGDALNGADIIIIPVAFDYHQKAPTFPMNPSSHVSMIVIEDGIWKYVDPLIQKSTKRVSKMKHSSLVSTLLIPFVKDLGIPRLNKRIVYHRFGGQFIIPNSCALCLMYVVQKLIDDSFKPGSSPFHSFSAMGKMYQDMVQKQIYFP